MTVTYTLIITVLALVVGQIVKVFDGFNTKYIPLINIGIGAAGAAISICFGLLPNSTPVEIIGGIVLCMSAALAAGGIYDAVKTGTVTLNKDATIDEFITDSVREETLNGKGDE